MACAAMGNSLALWLDVLLGECLRAQRLGSNSGRLHTSERQSWPDCVPLLTLSSLDW